MRILPLALFLVLAGCGQSPNAVAPAAARDDAAEPSRAETTDPQAAAELLRSYFALAKAHRRDEARALWVDPGGEAAVAGGLDALGDWRADVGAPGRVEGAAGSLYIDVPARIHGRTVDGVPFDRPARASLRRSNDVPGSSEAERRWRIFEIALTPNAAG